MKNQNTTIIVTGGTDGIGKATAQQFAERGASLLLISRNRTRGEAVAAELAQKGGKVTYLQADLSEMSDLRRVSDQIRQRFDRIDGLIHCAGGLFPSKRTLTSEGVEISFAIQYLARYVLTCELLDQLRASPSPKVVTVAGGSARVALDTDNLTGEKQYGGPFKRVQISGITNYLLTLEWIARYPGITFYNYGPGLVRTGMMRRSPLPLRLLMSSVGRLVSRTPADAGRDIVNLVSGEHPSGFYSVGVRRNDKAMAELASVSRTALLNYTETLANRLLVPA